jgi:type III restriction enzyme
MKIKFEPNLQYQKDAIDSVVNLFDGAPYIRSEDRISQEVSPNILKIKKEQLFDNYDRIASENSIDNNIQAKDSEQMDFSIEMETGTGKTYIYIRTILELYKKYGLTKFVIVVPSIAVKEGVLKTFEMTKDHFSELYNEKVQFFEYDSKKTTRVRHFALSNTLQVMVTNIQAFNTDDRIINQARDINNGVKLIDLIRAVHPVIIMDEPQEGMDTKNMQKRFNRLEPLFKLRYSATHKRPINIVYRLTPYDAYNQGLVKKISIYSIHEKNTQSNVEIDFKDIRYSSGKPEAKLSLNYKVGTDFKEKAGYFKELDNLEEKTRNPAYKGWIVERIYKGFDQVEKIQFSNGEELVKGNKHGWDKESIFREQIRWTIKQHFEKKEKFRNLGVKVLSLFFIDKVDNYIPPDGIIRKLFVELYDEEYRSFYKKAPLDINSVHNGYFAKTKSTGEYTDNINSMRKNKEIYNLIMKEKEKLLSIEEPLEFIFSHSALGVGWDNPNVFQICTLNESHSEIKKRQEIGRGLRICIDNTGQRYRDSETVTEGEEVNVLTVVPNESYYSFVSSYQDEINEETNDSREVKVRNARKLATQVNINENILNSKDFKNLWKRIQRKTKYMVNFREEELIEKCVDSLNDIVVKEQEISIEAKRISKLDTETNILENISNIGEGRVKSKAIKAKIDIADQISEQTSLSIPAVVKILEGISNKNMLGKNPVMYVSEAVNRIRNVLDKEMVRVINYKPINDEYPLSEFRKFNAQTYNNVVSSHKNVYDEVEYDSDIEKNFVLDIEMESQVKAFVKLPGWYKIDTPIGTYNPDFGLVLEKKELENDKETKYYFVIETKGSDDLEDLREDERLKIECAVKHFEAIGFEKYLAPIKNLNSLINKANI